MKKKIYFPRLLWESVKLGSLGALITSEVFVVLLSFAFGLSEMNLPNIGNALLLAFYIFLLGQMSGVFPAFLIGIVVGGLIGCVFFLFQEKITKKTAPFFSMLIALLPIGAIFISNLFGFRDMGFIFAIIVTFYLGAALWGGKKLLEKMEVIRIENQYYFDV